MSGAQQTFYKTELATVACVTIALPPRPKLFSVN
ncbi:hypothetical protein AA0113_g11166 [Alternaria arborescens]|uniref:Uncharacterized protein n=2 Tax=Alternaria sect. Alternaria TaxID=2499237 RepID=A0A4Q4N1H2_ALTAL|nr:hypothetical protein AA0118_g8106 [Alternaria tenuissima]RYN68091.1 hypothetical protein AA0117_g11403 [Alternaria alternata]RYO39783.1 hypothetical protein AA0113_g11166 [Alternaria arborescens]RYO53237.1 hypothetical protein AA0116_g10807 [Alternaria tenuissima]